MRTLVPTYVILMICLAAVLTSPTLATGVFARKAYLVSHASADASTSALPCARRLNILFRRRLARSFAAYLNDWEREQLSACVPGLTFEEDVEVTAQSNFWLSDRMNQRRLPLDEKLLPRDPTNGLGSIVRVFVLDTGVRRSHVEFGDVHFGVGANFVEDGFGGEEGDDCDGHGTHVASTIQRIAYRGKTIIHPVRVLDCHGNGELSALIAGLEWVERMVETCDVPAVVSLALGIKAGVWSRTLETIVESLDRCGVLVVSAAGNQQSDACEISPGNVEATLTVSASDDRDFVYHFANDGACVDVIVPGVRILGACAGYTTCDDPSDTSYAYQSGTSMAVANAVGAASRVLSVAPTMTPRALKEFLKSTATRGAVRGTMREDTPNLLVYVA